MSCSYAMIIGAMKCGTTSLYEMLVEHPDVAGCITKEPHYFCTDKKRPYERLWEHHGDIRSYRMEGSTSYTKYPHVPGVPERIRAYGLAPKFIYVVRDPIDRIESQYNFMVHNQGKPVDSFEHPRLINCSMYYQQLREYLRVFPDRSQYLVVDFGMLTSEPKRVVDACTDFLELDPLSEIVLKSSNRTATSLSDVWIQRIGPVKNTVGRLMPDGARARIKQWLRQSTPSVKRRIAPSERIRLQEILRPDTEQFALSFNFDVSKWGF